MNKPSVLLINAYKPLSCLICLLICCYSAVTLASNSNREQEYAELIAQSSIIGKTVWLESQGQRFLSLYTETEKTNNSDAVIILHDIGAYPDQKNVVYTLRTQLPMHHWASLALQMPLRETGATTEDYYALFEDAESRVNAAVDYLQKNGSKNIILIGYGLGAQMGLFIANNNPTQFAGLITISLPIPDTTVPQLQLESFIKNITLPYLDIFAEFDLATVVDTAKQRRLAAKANPVFWQQQLNGENHSFEQDHERLVKRIYSWLIATFQNQ